MVQPFLITKEHWCLIFPHLYTATMSKFSAHLLTSTRALSNAKTLTIFLGTPDIVFAGPAARPGSHAQVPNKQTIRCIGKWHPRDGWIHSIRCLFYLQLQSEV
jgi:hypothetical protein